MKHKWYLLSLLMFPVVAHAEGQDALGFIIYATNFIKIFGIWAVGVVLSILAFDTYRPEKLSSDTKKMIWVFTGAMAMLIWLWMNAFT